jgi:hypothetical protein
MPFLAFSADFPGCPSGSFKTEVASPIDSSTKILCSTKTSAGYIKHGPEWIYDYQGKILIKNSYDKDKLVSSLDPSKEPSERDKIDQAAKTDEKLSLKKDYSFIKTILHEVLHLWHPLRRPYRGQLAFGGFETQDCYVNGHKLDRFYKGETKTIKFDFDFSKRCSLRGSQELIWGKPQKVTFELRDMRDFKELEMQLTLHKKTKKIDDKLFYQIETKIAHALLRTETGSLEFEANYLLSVDTDKRKVLKGHAGELRVLEFDAQKIQEKHPLKIKTTELP